MKRLCRSALNWLKKRKLLRTRKPPNFGPVVPWEEVTYSFQLDWYVPHRRDDVVPKLDAKILTERPW